MDYVNSTSKVLHVVSEDNPHFVPIITCILSNSIIVNGKGSPVH